MERPTLIPEQEIDRNDGKEWSAMDIEDLTLALKDGGSVEGAAIFCVAPAPSMTYARKRRSLGCYRTDWTFQAFAFRRAIFLSSVT